MQQTDNIWDKDPRSKKIKRTPTDFNWKFDEEFIPKIFEFDTSNSGVTDKWSETSFEIVFFLQFFDEVLMSLVVKKTNTYGKQKYCVELADIFSIVYPYGDCWKNKTGRLLVYQSSYYNTIFFICVIQRSFLRHIILPSFFQM